MGKRGKREYVQVLRLMETFSQQEVYQGVRDALRLGTIGFDAVKHLLLCRIEGRPPRLDLAGFCCKNRRGMAERLGGPWVREC
jgi:hypothetical protein